MNNGSSPDLGSKKLMDKLISISNEMLTATTLKYSSLRQIFEQSFLYLTLTST